MVIVDVNNLVVSSLEEVHEQHPGFPVFLNNSSKIKSKFQWKITGSSAEKHSINSFDDGIRPFRFSNFDLLGRLPKFTCCAVNGKM
ncbi:hypothetical protein D3C87_83160 [compost metagenome]